MKSSSILPPLLPPLQRGTVTEKGLVLGEAEGGKHAIYRLVLVGVGGVGKYAPPLLNSHFSFLWSIHGGYLTQGITSGNKYF